MTKTPIIIDTDPGIDDAAALAIAIGSDKVDVRLITTVGGNVSLENVSNNVLKLLKFWDKKIPVAKGAKGPLVRSLSDASAIHGASGMDGFEFDGLADGCLLTEVAVEALYKEITRSNTPVTIVAIGPLTNIALLLKVHPDSKSNIERLIIMGGTITRGNKGVLSEFNMATDPEAAKIVFSSGVPIVMVGLDIGWKALVLPEDIEKIKAASKTGKMITALFSHYRGGSIKTGLKMYDPTAMAYLLVPEMFQTTETFVDIELSGALTAGCTLVDLKGYLGKPANATVCTDIDVQAFRTWFVDQFYCRGNRGD